MRASRAGSGADPVNDRARAPESTPWRRRAVPNKVCAMNPTRHLPALLLGLAVATPVIVQSGCAGTTTRESSGEYIDNTAITAKVKTALYSDEQVSGMDVNVESFRGTVQLSGFVDTEAQKRRAESIARGVPGVEDVRNNLQVKAHQSSDRDRDNRDRRSDNMNP